MCNRVDLHIHSSFSDGSETPSRIMELLTEAGIDVFSIADHDTIAALNEMRSFVPAEVAFIPGIEITTLAEKGECHILGYAFDKESPAIAELIGKIASMRIEKMKVRIKGLEDNFGIKLTEDEVGYIFSRNSPAKPHLAQVLIDRGLAATISEAITEYINKCRVEGLRISSREAVEYIHRAGGAAVWAHPLGGEGETPLTEERFTSRLKYLMACGIDGMECFYSRYDAAKREILLKTAERENLFISGGSDFHGTVKNIPLGRLDADDRYILPEKLTILEHPAIVRIMENNKPEG